MPQRRTTLKNSQRWQPWIASSPSAVTGSEMVAGVDPRLSSGAAGCGHLWISKMFRLVEEIQLYEKVWICHPSALLVSSVRMSVIHHVRMLSWLTPTNIFVSTLKVNMEAIYRKWVSRLYLIRNGWSSGIIHPGQWIISPPWPIGQTKEHLQKQTQ